MKTREPTRILVLASLGLLLPACRKAAEPGRPAGTGETIPVAAATDIDPEKIAAATGVRFRILKTDTIGQMPSHLFYSVSLPGDDPGPRLEALADALIRGAIAARPRTYHSFTVHFFLDRELKETVEESAPFARATYLPEGDWRTVGRASIEDYAGYVLAVARLDGR